MQSYITLWQLKDHNLRCWPYVQYIPRNMHTVFALLCFVMIIHWLIFPYPSGLLHWHCGNLTIAPVPAKQPWWIWINTSCEFIMNDCITRQSKAQQNRVHNSWDILYPPTEFAAIENEYGTYGVNTGTQYIIGIRHVYVSKYNVAIYHRDR